MVRLKRTNSYDADFKLLVQQLNQELEERYGTVQQLYAPLNQLPLLETVVLAYVNNEVAGCGCFKPNEQFGVPTAEIKRMFVSKHYRGRGLSRLVLEELERWAQEIGYNNLVLETGSKQPEAIGLYQKSGYQPIKAYEPYVGMPDSLCFQKELAL